MGMVLIYFSRDGSTKLAAEYLGKKWGCHLVELKEAKPSRSFILSGYRAASGRRRKLTGDPWGKYKDADTLILGAPIWAGNGNPVLNAFLDRAELQGKTVHLFTVQADPERKTGEKVLDFYAQRVTERGGSPGSKRALHGNSPGKVASKDAIEKQLADWNL